MLQTIDDLCLLGGYSASIPLTGHIVYILEKREQLFSRCLNVNTAGKPAVFKLKRYSTGVHVAPEYAVNHALFANFKCVLYPRMHLMISPFNIYEHSKIINKKVAICSF